MRVKQRVFGAEQADGPQERLDTLPENRTRLCPPHENGRNDEEKDDEEPGKHRYSPFQVELFHVGTISKSTIPQ